jgi:hypothetical protein
LQQVQPPPPEAEFALAALRAAPRKFPVPEAGRRRSTYNASSGTGG